MTAPALGGAVAGVMPLTTPGAVAVPAAEPVTTLPKPKSAGWVSSAPAGPARSSTVSCAALCPLCGSDSGCAGSQAKGCGAEDASLKLGCAVKLMLRSQSFAEQDA